MEIRSAPAGRNEQKIEKEKILVSIFQCITCLFTKASKVACNVVTTLKSRMNINRNIQREEKKKRWSPSLLPTQNCSMFVQFVYMLMHVFVNIMFALAGEATEAAHHDRK